MDLDLTGRHALVCGASEGIGRAAARELALLGADVTVLSRRAPALQAVADTLPRSGAQRHRV
ncbi:SDR family NAD(P)-dependent oxidoreductase, partial [Luteimonas sp. SDU101]|uniref:SDR family NAD(P)-dependent oxidoreductase n=1 Tax=Luteimonas sp. SDU101 TaxID=3422593 RepID=UPI003EB8A459